jgi:hypothetical protein
MNFSAFVQGQLKAKGWFRSVSHRSDRDGGNNEGPGKHIKQLLKLLEMLVVDIVLIRKKVINYHIIININLYYEHHGHHKKLIFKFYKKG